MLRALLLFFISLILLFFGYFNNDTITIKLIPSISISLPLYLVLYISLALGVLIAGINNFIKKK